MSDKELRATVEQARKHASAPECMAQNLTHLLASRYCGKIFLTLPYSSFVFAPMNFF